MLKYVIFDLDDTLLDFSRGEQECITYLLQKYGVTDLPHGMQVYQAHNHWVWSQIEHGAERQPLLDQRFAVVFAKLGISVNGHALQQEYNTMLAHNFHVIPGATTLLDQLQSAGLTLIVGTNGVKTTQLSRLQGSGLASYFRQAFISEDLGVSKPDSNFFTAIFNQLPNMTVNNTIMVGDSLTSDIQGANSVDLPSIWYNPRHLSNDHDYRPTKIVTDYDQLKRLLSH
ncbi:YjjG family noncanonical pyrimidine nucleotidase [Lactiplantibacillus sp. WILCCON 0030]|uniref:YjjG family noncanonical pyrimidine nucleotidase n=1 Tax=Lactiplantibacillus brownii TaxID=3069269 RepID=A0ABU1ACS3_9LACO|nr:YjjG family noncanonical pyrimidine nucleotidase [Lactiplantibacillus brownii]MDQ7938178.1 YjjG family noncanonical pyrimidine nucleotidase [Lactiplantibacillus brownii]